MNRMPNAPRSNQPTSKFQSPRQRSIVPAVTTPKPPARLPRLVETAMYVARSSGGGSRVISLFAAVVAAVLATPPSKVEAPSQRRAILGEATNQNRGSIAQKMCPQKSTRVVPTRSTSLPDHRPVESLPKSHKQVSTTVPAVGAFTFPDLVQQDKQVLRPVEAAYLQMLNS